MAYYFTTFVVIRGLLMMLEAIVPVIGQSTVQGCESRDPLISIAEEIQQLRVEIFDQLNKQVQGIHASFQDIRSEIDGVKTRLQTVDRRSQEHGQSVHVFLNESLQDIKGQIGSVMASLQAVDRSSQDHDICNERGQSIREFLNESLQGVDQRLQEHDISLKNQTHNLWTLANEMKSQHDTCLTSLQAVDRCLQERDIYTKNNSQNMQNLANGICRSVSGVCDCSDIKASGQTATGVYEVCVGNQPNRTCTNAFCDMETANRTSLVFQRRKDGSVNFNRTWAEYKQGFGNRSGEFWLGNEMLHLLTSKRNYKLRVDLEDFQRNKGFAEYTTFAISSSVEKYRLTVSGYSGNAGDSLVYHNNHQFSTQDSNNDVYKASENCAQKNGGGWWFLWCFHSSLNGIYYNPARAFDDRTGIHWYHWRRVSLKATEMKLIPLA